MVTPKSIRIFTVHNLTAITVFVFSAILYISTLAPSVSLWDCGEFIACAARLEVGHPPGAPLYLLITRIFTLFASSPQTIAWWANLVSALSSAMAVALLYSIIRHVITSIWQEADSSTSIISAGVGALLFAVTDTFWFSAVESEVYALSLFFTTLTLWALLRWEREFAATGSGIRWLYLIVYIIGLSTGVHLLNLLSIPVVILFVWLRIKGFSLKRVIVSLSVGCVVLALVLSGIIQNGLWPAGKFELLMVNTLGFPINSGLILFVGSLFVFLFMLVFLSLKKSGLFHFVILSFLLFLTGYGSYAMIIIRSSAATPVNLNTPDNLFSFDSFINREQYGNKPLFYGPSYNSRPTGIKTKRSFRESHGRYEAFERNQDYTYDADQKIFFPRMHSPQEIHKYGYSYWAGVDIASDEMPSLVANLKFLMRYQLDFMYFRYFLWNFSGRQNDIQGAGDRLDGNWISGIPFIDAVRLGNRSALHPDEIQNRGHNQYFMLPLLFGIVGIIYLYRRGNDARRYLLSVGMLMVMTGPAIVLYLNQTPFEPRERDYAFVGSFMAFSIFIGIGVFGFISWIANRHKVKNGRLLAGVVSLLALPGLMLAQNYGDHNRGGRNFEINIARSYLESCEPNAILFTYGDNDTYPLWYAQEVERVRTDVRVVNFGLMGADWCINQLANTINDSKALRFSIALERYREGDMDNAFLLGQSDDYNDLAEVVNTLGSNDQSTKLPLNSGGLIDFAPTNSLKFVKNCDTVCWQVNKDVLYKNDIALLDIIASNISERPVYFTAGSPEELFLGLNDYILDLGLVLKLETSKPRLSKNEIVDCRYDMFMNKIILGDPAGAYYDSFIRNTFEVIRYRKYSNQLALDLLAASEKEKAAAVLEKSLIELPVELYAGSQGNIDLPALLYRVGMKSESRAVASYLLLRHLNSIYYYASQNNISLLNEEIENGRLLLNQLNQIGAKDLHDKLSNSYIELGLELKTVN